MHDFLEEACSSPYNLCYTEHTKNCALENISLTFLHISEAYIRITNNYGIRTYLDIDEKDLNDVKPSSLEKVARAATENV